MSRRLFGKGYSREMKESRAAESALSRAAVTSLLVGHVVHMMQVPHGNLAAYGPGSASDHSTLLVINREIMCAYRDFRGGCTSGITWRITPGYRLERHHRHPAKPLRRPDVRGSAGYPDSQGNEDNVTSDPARPACRGRKGPAGRAPPKIGPQQMPAPASIRSPAVRSMPPQSSDRRASGAARAPPGDQDKSASRTGCDTRDCAGHHADNRAEKSLEKGAHRRCHSPAIELTWCCHRETGTPANYPPGVSHAFRARRNPEAYS